jgi:hypothetical protein
VVFLALLINLLGSVFNLSYAYRKFPIILLDRLVRIEQIAAYLHDNIHSGFFCYIYYFVVSISGIYICVFLKDKFDIFFISGRITRHSRPSESTFHCLILLSDQPIVFYPNLSLFHNRGTKISAHERFLPRFYAPYAIPTLYI